MFIYFIPLVRPNWGYFVKLFFGLFVATAIAGGIDAVVETL